LATSFAIGAIKRGFVIVPHGLRKAGATIAANNGATSRQLMAIFGWDSIRMAEQYTRRADQQRLADDAMHLIEAR
jgi:Phage integrase family.